MSSSIVNQDNNNRSYQVINGVVRQGLHIEVPRINEKAFFTKIINIILEKIQPYHRRYTPSSSNVLEEIPYEQSRSHLDDVISDIVRDLEDRYYLLYNPFFTNVYVRLERSISNIYVSMEEEYGIIWLKDDTNNCMIDLLAGHRIHSYDITGLALLEIQQGSIVDT